MTASISTDFANAVAERTLFPSSRRSLTQIVRQAFAWVRFEIHQSDVIRLWRADHFDYCNLAKKWLWIAESLTPLEGEVLGEIIK